MLDFPDGSSFVVPEGWHFDPADKPGWCRSCGAHVLWLTNRVSGKRAPFNHDGVNHFATCPDADRWRRR